MATITLNGIDKIYENGFQAVTNLSLDIGDAWLRTAPSALLVVPSVIVPEECNVLINPLHADAAGIRAAKLRPWVYDLRLA